MSLEEVGEELVVIIFVLVGIESDLRHELLTVGSPQSSDLGSRQSLLTKRKATKYRNDVMLHGF